MSTTRHGARLRAIAVVLAGVVAAGCDDARTDVSAPDAGIAFGFQLAGDGRNLPSIRLGYRRPFGTAQVPPVDSSVTITMRGLDSLTTRVYQVWLANLNADSTALIDVVKATGQLRWVRTDSTINAEGDVVTTEVSQVIAPSASSFTNGGPATRVELRVNRATTGVDAFTRQIVLVTIEQDANATTPGDVRPLWARRSDRGAEVAEVIPGPVTIAANSVANGRFGNFAPKPANEYRFVPVGRGRGDILGRVLTLDDSSLSRPPVGYYYSAALVQRDSATNTPTDTLDLGAQTAPWPRRGTSLVDADVAIPDVVVQAVPPSIAAAASRLVADTVSSLVMLERPYKGYSEVRITLESKYGRADVMAPTIVVSGTVPGVVRYGTR
jgi:hypothetical protein